MKAIPLALAGALSGALTAAAIDLKPLGDAPGIMLSGFCVGLGGPGCRGAPAEFYLYPGLVFGLAFATLLLAGRRLHIAGAAVFAIGATLANAAALVAWTVAFTPVAWLFEGVAFDSGIPLFGLTGAIAGAVGGGLLGCCALRLLGETGWWRGLAAGAALGLLLPLFPMFHGGEFVFYALWQAGYAAALLAVH